MHATWGSATPPQPLVLSLLPPRPLPLGYWWQIPDAFLKLMHWNPTALALPSSPREPRAWPLFTRPSCPVGFAAVGAEAPAMGPGQRLCCQIWSSKCLLIASGKSFPLRLPRGPVKTRAGCWVLAGLSRSPHSRSQGTSCPLTAGLGCCPSPQCWATALQKDAWETDGLPPLPEPPEAMRAVGGRRGVMSGECPDGAFRPGPSGLASGKQPRSWNFPSRPCSPALGD